MTSEILIYVETVKYEGFQKVLQLFLHFSQNQ
jgi:hypothetical protein